MHITSLQNPLVKSIVRLKASAHQRRRDGLMLVEGADEIGLALAAGHRPRTVIRAPTHKPASQALLDANVVTVSGQVFDKLSYREKPDGWLAVFEAPVRSLNGITLRANPIVVVIEGIEKPGNLGAILRSADAAGVDAVLVCDAQADLYGPNVVRSSRGTIFSVPVVQVSSEQVLDFLRTRGISAVAATPAASSIYTSVDLSGPVALVVGTESRGLSQRWLDGADALVRIPMLGKVNSLNVSVAAALLIFEALRQRGAAPSPQA